MQSRMQSQIKSRIHGPPSVTTRSSGYIRPYNAYFSLSHLGMDQTVVWLTTPIMGRVYKSKKLATLSEDAVEYSFQTVGKWLPPVQLSIL